MIPTRGTAISTSIAGVAFANPANIKAINDVINHPNEPDLLSGFLSTIPSSDAITPNIKHITYLDTTSFVRFVNCTANHATNPNLSIIIYVVSYFSGKSGIILNLLFCSGKSLTFSSSVFTVTFPLLKSDKSLFPSFLSINAVIG